MKWFRVLLVLSLAYIASATDEDNIEDRLVREIQEYTQTGVETQSLLDDMATLQAPKLFHNVQMYIEDRVVCILCRVLARLLISYRRIDGNRELAEHVANKICVWARIEDETVCQGVIKLNIGTIMYVLENNEDLTTTKACAILAQSNHCKPTVADTNWTIAIPPVAEQPPVTYSTDTTPIRILQLTDVHFDDFYREGANAECGEPLCCGLDQGTPANEAAKAGAWGDYRGCDMPWYSVRSLFDQIQTHEYDLVYFTGDITNHRVWQTTPEMNTNDIKHMYAQLKTIFKDKPLYGVVGNHESSPVNVFSPETITDPKYSTQWLYDLLVDEWSYWLPNSTYNTIKKGGFYTTLVRPGFRIVVLNNNVAYNLNWWLLYDDKDPYGQLQWFADTLAQAEKDGERVHILAHIPAGDSSCYKKWSHEYNKIVNRFAHIIATQMNGHTHYDEMNLYYNTSDLSQVISVAYNGGSFTTFVNVNPNYRIYTINPQTFEVDDFEEWTFNLTDANLKGNSTPPQWYKLYSFKEAYGLQSMELSQLQNLVEKMPTDQSLMDLYYRFKVRDALPSMEQGCNKKCHETNLCNLVTTEFGDTRKCRELTSKYDSHYRTP